MVSFLGVPVKRVNVNVQPTRLVVPGGQAIGVALEMAGVLVVGASDVGPAVSPARKAGIRAGDRILSVNGTAIKSAQHLSDLIKKGGEAKLTVQRGDDNLNVPVTPVKDGQDGAYRLGIWVRDSTAGVGTLSFYDPQDRHVRRAGPCDHRRGHRRNPHGGRGRASTKAASWTS